MRKSLLFLLFLCFVSVAFANNEKDLKAIVYLWNDLHNTRNTQVFRELYAPQVLFYGRNYSGEKCYRRKKSFLNADFYQEIISPVTLSYYSSGTIKCSFTKRVTYKRTVKEHFCYLLMQKQGGKYLITGESDLLTDKNLNVQLDLGKEVAGPGKKITTYLYIGAGLLLIGGLVFYQRKRKKELKSAYVNDTLTPIVQIIEPAPPVVMENEIVEKVKVAVMEDLKGRFPEEPIEKKKGDAFEKFIVERFKEEYFTLKEWRSDKYHEGRYAASNKLPDLEYQFRTNYYNARFAVECKWRAGFNNGKIEWAKDYQLKNYKQYERTEGLPVFVIIGVGGQPNNPESLYIVPLRDIYSNVLTQYQLKKYYRYGRGDFFLHADTMVLQ